MFQKILFIVLGLVSISANAQWSAETYFVGEQKISATESKECFLELKYSADQSQVSLRGIVTNSHEGHLATVGELVTSYIFIGGAIQKNGYYYQNTTPQAPVKQLVLIAEDPRNPTSMTAAIFHGNHHDPVTCENLVVAQGEELVEAQELFAEFEHIGEGDHDHDH